MIIGIFGGSFDPPHIGHETIIKEVPQALGLDKLLVVPAFLNPFKKQFFAPPELRITWMQKLVEPYDNVGVLDFEINQGKPTPSIETVEYVKQRYAPEKIFLIIGADNLEGLSRWHRYEELKEMVEFAVIRRNGIAIPESYRSIDIHVPISSTQMRQDTLAKKEAEGQSVLQNLPAIIAPFVFEYYESMNLTREKNAKKS